MILSASMRVAECRNSTAMPYAQVLHRARPAALKLPNVWYRLERQSKFFQFTIP